MTRSAGLGQGATFEVLLPGSSGTAHRATSQTDRSAVDVVAKSFDLDVDRPVVDAVQRVAESRGIPMSQVALAWLLVKPVVSAPIVGATKPHHLADAAAAVAITLTEEEIRQLEEPYTPQAPYWW